MYRRTRLSVLVLLIVVAAGVTLAAQAGARLSGRLINSLSGDPIPDATVQIDELGRTAMSDASGTFAFENVPPGVYHLSVHSQGYSTRRTEVTVSAAAALQMDITIDPELHFEEVTTVTGEARSQFDLFQPTAVLAGQELSKQLEMSLGATLESQPGVAARSFGPAPARPVIRGLDGDRVQILQDGQRMGDLSSQSADHAVVINPAAAQRIEVVRGPATLLYGANAIGGLINVLTNDIATSPVQGTSGNFTADLGSAAGEAGAAADIRAGNGTFAFHAGGGGRHAGDVRTPDGKMANSQSRNGFGSVGAGWTGGKGYFGANYGYDDTRFGIPIVEEGLIESTPRRHAFTLRGGAQNLTGVFDSFRATLAVRRYRHDELNTGEVETAFKNNTEEIELMGSHRAFGRLKGSLGASVLNRAFGATGDEALSPDVDQRAISAFLYEEVTWPHITLQFGGRTDHARYTPAGEDERTYNAGSGSIGLLLRPAAADDRLIFALSLARAARYPALEELFYFGNHPGNFAFEIGNPDLRPEHPIGTDLSVRWRGARGSGEIGYFRNSINDYIFRSPLSPTQLRARQAEFIRRFPRDETAPRIEESLTGEEPFPVIEYVPADSLLQGLEAHTDIAVVPALVVELGADYVRGQLRDSGDPLPRIPPFRFLGGVRYQYNAFQIGGTVTATAKQDRVFAIEEPTDGYQLLKLFSSYSFPTGGGASTITARVDNVTDELYRNHLSLIKDLTPETGRNFKLV
jgi:iron complex outermembrane receptor protein